MLANDQSPTCGLGTVLILEDEVLVSTMLEELLLDLGATQVLVCGSLDEAQNLAERGAISCAILDVQVGKMDSFAVADALTERDIPFLFASGFGPEAISERHRNRPLLGKPFSNDQLRDCIQAVIAAR